MAIKFIDLDNGRMQLLFLLVSIRPGALAARSKGEAVFAVAVVEVKQYYPPSPSLSFNLKKAKTLHS